LYADRGVYFEGGEPAFAKVDREQWVRIIHNVIKNALQSVAEGVEPEVRVRVVRLNKTIEVAVADNGAGIPEDMKEKVFEPKFSTKSSGMGLGLAMVKNLVENFGGTIVFNSTAKGTTFLIQLPLEEPNTAA
jgi:signal transduction histidine kinase